MSRDGRANARQYGLLTLATGLMMFAVGAIGGSVGADEAVPAFGGEASQIHSMAIDAEAAPADGVEAGDRLESAVPARTCGGAHGTKSDSGTLGTKALDDSDEEGDPTGSRTLHIAAGHCVAGTGGC